MRCATTAPLSPASKVADVGSTAVSIPGSAAAPRRRSPSRDGRERAATAAVSRSAHRERMLAHSQAGGVMDELDRDLVGLTPIKARIRDIRRAARDRQAAHEPGLRRRAQPAHELHRQPRDR